MSRLQLSILGVTIVVLLFSLFLLFGRAGIIPPKPIGQAPSPTPLPTTRTGLEIAKETALFLDRTLQPNGDIKDTYYCYGETCTVINIGPQPKGFIAKAYYELYKATGEEGYKEKAERVGNFLLKACSERKEICVRNAIPFYYLYTQTHDERYKEAILKVADDLYSHDPDTGYVISWSNTGDDLALLYELTGDKKYKDKLEHFAGDLLANGYYLDREKPEENPIFYQEGDLVVRKFSIQIVWDKYLQAYRITKNPIYLEAAKEFFRKANIKAHFKDFDADIKNSEDMSFISGLLDLRDAIDGPKEKEFFGSVAHKLAQWSYINRSDNPQNKKFNGDYGFLYNSDRIRSTKSTIQSAWRVSQYLRMLNETFTIR